MKSKIDVKEEVHGKLKEEGFEVEDIKRLFAKPPNEPDFPIIMLFVATARDILDVLELTGIGYVVTLIATVLVGSVIFIWMISRNSGGNWWKSILVKKALRRLGIGIIIELIPGVGTITPTWIVLVLLTHYKERKVVNLVWEAIDIAGGDVRALEREVSLPKMSRIKRVRSKSKYGKPANKNFSTSRRFEKRKPPEKPDFSGVTYPKPA